VSACARAHEHVARRQGCNRMSALTETQDSPDLAEMPCALSMTSRCQHLLCMHLPPFPVHQTHPFSPAVSMCLTKAQVLTHSPVHHTHPFSSAVSICLTKAQELTHSPVSTHSFSSADSICHTKAQELPHSPVSTPTCSCAAPCRA